MAAEAGTHEHHEVHHPYHLVEPSPWPAVGTIAAFVLVSGGLMYMHEISGWRIVMPLGILGLIITMVGWWRDVIRESREGAHTDPVARGLRIGMALFITSEVLFFAAFFWAYFWGALVWPETIEGYRWLPEGIEPVETWDVPFLNTLILLTSGCTVTWAHHAVRKGDNRTATKALALTVLLGLLFTGFQAYEYVETIHKGFTIKSGIFGSTFYMATGFHGFHVMIGTTFLIVCTLRAYYDHFRPDKHVGLEAAAWYWHFVDVVWLFLFSWVYWWGGVVAHAWS